MVLHCRSSRGEFWVVLEFDEVLLSLGEVGHVRDSPP